MVLGQKVLVSGVVILLCFTLIAQDEYQGGGVLPLELLRPQYGEELCFPRDYVIGELGRGNASEESYRYARLLTANLAAGNETNPGLDFPEEKRLSVQRRVDALEPRSWRVGGGRVEPDGAVSFLIRFLGRAESLTGELYVRRAEPKLVETAAPLETGASAETMESVAVPVSGEAVAAAAVPAANESSAAGEITVAVDGTSGRTVESLAEDVLWRVDDILLENPRGLSEGKYSPSGADMTAYERFF